MRASTNCTGTFERLIASNLIGSDWPGETTGLVVELSMCSARHAAMSVSTSPRFVANQSYLPGGTPAVASFVGDGTATVPPRAIGSLRNLSNFGIDADGSAGE